MSQPEFDEDRWAQIVQKPDWYSEYSQFAKKARQKYGEDSAELQKLNKKVRRFFEKNLDKGRVVIGAQGPNLDVQRNPIDTIVIHHTSANPGYKLSFLNTVQLLNIYAPYFAEPTIRSEENLKGHPIWSGHFYEGRQVFWGYHWLMRMDGEFTRLLDDNKIGWHAGNWDTNRRSIGICLDNDYETKDPKPQLLQKLANFIKQNYPYVTSENIIGHCEARESTICPGNNFIGGWKKQLLNLV